MYINSDIIFILTSFYPSKTSRKEQRKFPLKIEFGILSIEQTNRKRALSQFEQQFPFYMSLNYYCCFIAILPHFISLCSS